MITSIKEVLMYECIVQEVPDCFYLVPNHIA